MLTLQHIRRINNWQRRWSAWPSLRHDGKAVEAVRFKRLSVSNFASGWIPLIYVGKESQSAGISPEMPRQVNCILSLATYSNTCKSHTHARAPNALCRSTLFSSGRINTFWFIQLKSVFPETVVGEQTGFECGEIVSLTLTHAVVWMHVSWQAQKLADWAMREQLTQKSFSPPPPPVSLSLSDVHSERLRSDLTQLYRCFSSTPLQKLFKNRGGYF